jgi:hypothetical protein
MEPILVPGPGKEAFKKLRPISDLIRAQVGHFKHLQEKLPPTVRATLPQHSIVTEDDAAHYIAAMTAYFRSQITPAVESRPESTPSRIPARVFPAVAITAGPGKPAAKGRSTTRKGVSSRKKKAKSRPTRETK